MRAQNKTVSTEKSNGRIYTPSYIVCNILDMAGYYGYGILKKHVIDNSCGDGAFITEIVTRYCESARRAGYSDEELSDDLSTYIHGIEIDETECKKCVERASAVARSQQILVGSWDIRCADAMKVHDYDGKMDFVLGNPPYVRVHNVGDSFDCVKSFSFAQSGMTDFYLVFYEIGLKMLNQTGILGYITPSSFFSSLAGSALRKHLIENNLVEKIIDLRHYQAFAATTYTTIVILKKERESCNASYYRYDEKNKIPYYVDSLSPKDFYLRNNFYFSNKEDLALLKKILNNAEQCNVSVKNGFATLCDDVFIGEFGFESSYLIPVIKASTGKKAHIFYPYGRDARLIPESEIKQDGKLYLYLLSHKEQLARRSSDRGAENDWYAFGRSQAIGDTYKNKLAINTLLRTASDLKLVPAPAGVGVYGGLYLVGSEQNIRSAREALFSDDFATYISLLGKYKSGGYYTFSSKDVKAYLDYKLTFGGIPA